MAKEAFQTSFFAQVCNTVAAEIVLSLDESTSLELVLWLVAELPKGWRLRFYDRDFASRSDPGEYVWVARQGRRYRLRRSNHGWTSRWEEATPEEAAEYAYRCRSHRDPIPAYPAPIVLERELPIKRLISRRT